MSLSKAITRSLLCTLSRKSCLKEVLNLNKNLHFTVNN